jgi:E3 ubiquitin-protein ligase MARCH6
MLFILILWVAFAVFLAAVFSLPILLGRSFFKLFTARDVHDGYSFITGFYLLWACYIVGKAVDRMDKRRQRRGHDGPRAEFPVFLIKRSLLWLAKISYMYFLLGLVIPILISLVMDFYIILPIRLAVNPTLQARIRIVDTWALGLLVREDCCSSSSFATTHLSDARSQQCKLNPL